MAMRKSYDAAFKVKVAIEAIKNLPRPGHPASVAHGLVAPRMGAVERLRAGVRPTRKLAGTASLGRSVFATLAVKRMLPRRGGLLVGEQP